MKNRYKAQNMLVYVISLVVNIEYLCQQSLVDLFHQPQEQALVQRLCEGTNGV